MSKAHPKKSNSLLKGQIFLNMHKDCKIFERITYFFYKLRNDGSLNHLQECLQSILDKEMSCALSNLQKINIYGQVSIEEDLIPTISVFKENFKLIMGSMLNNLWNEVAMRDSISQLIKQDDQRKKLKSNIHLQNITCRDTAFMNIKNQDNAKQSVSSSLREMKQSMENIVNHKIPTIIPFTNHCSPIQTKNIDQIPISVQKSQNKNDCILKTNDSFDVVLKSLKKEIDAQFSNKPSQENLFEISTKFPENILNSKNILSGNFKVSFDSKYAYGLQKNRHKEQTNKERKKNNWTTENISKSRTVSPKRLKKIIPKRQRKIKLATKQKRSLRSVLEQKFKPFKDKIIYSQKRTKKDK